jgi:hypothetical protein
MHPSIPPPGRQNFFASRQSLSSALAKEGIAASQLDQEPLAKSRSLSETTICVALVVSRVRSSESAEVGPL